MNDPAKKLPDDDDPQLPPRLASDLARLYSARSETSPMVDATIRLAITAHFHRRFAHRRAVRRILGWSAAGAAIIAIVARIGPWTATPGPATVAMHAASPIARDTDQGDLNRDGKVDILDAFYLARQLKAGTTPNPAWDVNGDGVVDQRDVDAIAERAVSLDRRGIQ